jgi:hypothetical protein
MSYAKATVDIAMMCIVILGPVALTQSLTILVIYAKWILREDFVPCLEQPCRLLECIQYKDSLNLPNVQYTFNLFGFQLTGIPRTVLHMLAGDHLEFWLRDQKYIPLITFLAQYPIIHILWGNSTRFLVNLNSHWNFR